MESKEVDRLIVMTYSFCWSILLATWATDGKGSVFFPTILSLLYLIIGCLYVIIILFDDPKIGS